MRPDGTHRKAVSKSPLFEYRPDWARNRRAACNEQRAGEMRQRRKPYAAIGLLRQAASRTFIVHRDKGLPNEVEVEEDRPPASFRDHDLARGAVEVAAAAVHVEAATRPDIAADPEGSLTTELAVEMELRTALETSSLTCLQLPWSWPISFEGLAGSRSTSVNDEPCVDVVMNRDPPPPYPETAQTPEKAANVLKIPAKWLVHADSGRTATSRATSFWPRRRPRDW
jgi:hypothetical protein